MEVCVSRLIVANFGVSIDGFSAGTSQDLQNPLGLRGPEIMEWFFHTRTFRSMHGLEGGETGIDDGLARDGLTGFGAWILGRNMFGPVRGPWPDESWKGWWGDEPPYHVPAYVLTHHARDPITMAGGTEFIFVTGGIYAALELARTAAGDKDVRLGGGVATVRQFLHGGSSTRCTSPSGRCCSVPASRFSRGSTSGHSATPATGRSPANVPCTSSWRERRRKA